MDPLTPILEQFQKARRVEDIFGALPASPNVQLRAAKAIYRRLARAVHPDQFTSEPQHLQRATEALKLLNRWWEAAKSTIEAGRYGASEPVIGSAPTLRSKRHTYTILNAVAAGDIADVYRAQFEVQGASTQAIVKIIRDRSDHDLAANEVHVLRRLWASDTDELEVFGQYLPYLYEAFVLDDARHVTVLSYAEGYYSLSDVMRAWPDGVEPQTMAWVFNRLLEVLAWSHRQKIVHGAVLPDHVLIHPVNHGALLVDWSYAVQNFGDPSSGPHLKVISSGWQAYYPGEVFEKRPATPGTDIYMAAQCMIALLGGDPKDPKPPQHLPLRLQGLLKACRLANPLSRYNDALELYESLQDALRMLYGPPRYHPFHMP